jgi:hypothetical protein
MTKYVGYLDDSAIPFKQGEKVVIPAGTKVKTMHPSRNEYVTKRRQTITVHHLLNGRSIRVAMMSNCDRHAFPQFANAYAEFDALREMMRDMTGDELRLAYAMQDEILIHPSNATVCWPGTGGYWCEADINDLLAANRRH